MKKNKLIFKVDGNKRGKVYIGGKWQKDVCVLDIHGEPRNYTVTIEKHKRDAKGRLLVKANEIETETKIFKIQN